MKFRIIFFLLGIWMFNFQLLSQTATIKGKITNDKTGESLPGVNILSDQKNGTVTDIEGNFELKIKFGKVRVTFSFIGYNSFEKTFFLSNGEVKTYNLSLVERMSNLNMVVVSGSAYEKKISEETVSIDVIKPSLINNTNARSIDEALQKMPSIKIIDGQVSIRSGSGYSYGTGSRVQVIVDGQSYLSPDLNEVRWKFVPTDNIEQVEVIKGAASVLYGSSSMNGVVNIMTAWPKTQPETKLIMYEAIYDHPRRDELDWWKNDYKNTLKPNYNGISLSHMQKFGNLDVVAGGRFNRVQSYLKDMNEIRGSADFKLRYRVPKINLSFGINGNYSRENAERFIFFKDSGPGGYTRLDGGGSSDSYMSLSIVPHVTYFTPKGNRHKLIGMYFNLTDIELEGGNKPAELLTAEYQYQHHFRKSLIWTTGINGSYGWMNNRDLYAGVKPKTIFASLYTQVEKRIDRLTFLAGLRYEAYMLTGIKDLDTAIFGPVKYNLIYEASKPIFRGGMNYRISPKTFLRASVGQGYRFPSIAERFLHSNVSQLYIVPNIDLKPEKGWNYEVGIKQDINIRNLNIVADLALFWMDYTNFITYTLGSYKSPDKPTEAVIGFKPYNVKNARIAGLEVSLLGDGKIGPVDLTFLAGYTFTYPADLDADTSQKNVGKFLQNLFGSMGKLDSTQMIALLKYRNRHVIKFSLDADYKRLSLGMTLDWCLNFEKIDGYFSIFNIVSPGINDYLKDYPGGTAVIDGRIGYDITKNSKLMLIIKNLTNVEYSERPGLIGPPRAFVFQYQLSF